VRGLWMQLAAAHQELPACMPWPRVNVVATRVVRNPALRPRLTQRCHKRNAVCDVDMVLTSTQEDASEDAPETLDAALLLSDCFLVLQGLRLRCPRPCCSSLVNPARSVMASP
jgi:hypothetical protein